MPNYDDMNKMEQEVKKNAEEAQAQDTARYANAGNGQSTGTVLLDSSHRELKAIAQELKKIGDYFGSRYKHVFEIGNPDELDSELKESIKNNFGFDEFNSKLFSAVEKIGKLVPAIEKYASADTKANTDNKERVVGREADDYIRMKEMLDSCMADLDGCLLYEESNTVMFRTLYSRTANTAVLLEDMTDGHLILPFKNSEIDENGNEIHRIALSDNHIGIRTAAMEKKERELNRDYNTSTTLTTAFVHVDDVPLFPHEPTEDDISQGSLGDCYLLAALSAIARNDPARIKDAIKDHNDGTVTVRFYNESDEPYYVHIEKSVPYVKSMGSAPFAKGALWVKMIEKAYAASDLHKHQNIERGSSYSTIIGGDSGRFLKTFLGPAAKIETDRSYIIEYPSTVTGPYSEDELKDFNLIKNAIDGNIIAAASSRSEDDFASIRKETNSDGSIVDNDSVENSGSRSYYGVFPRHAYTVTGTKEVNGSKYVVLRNPHNTEGIIIGKDGKPVISKDRSTVGEIQVELRNFRMLFDSVSTAKTNLEPVDRTRMQQAAEFRNNYGDTLKSFAESIKKTEHIFGLSFGDSPQFTKLSADAKKLVAALDAQPPAMSLIDRCFGNFINSAKDYKTYREAPAANSREQAAKNEKDRRPRSIERITAVDNILRFADEFEKRRTQAPVQVQAEPTLDERIAADKSATTASENIWITMDIINERVQQKKDALLSEDIGNFTAETAERTALAMSNPRFKELRYLICEGDMEESASINTALLEARAMLRSGHTTDDLRRSEIGANPSIAPYLDLIAQTVAQDEAMKEKDAEFTRGVLKDVLPAPKAPEVKEKVTEKVTEKAHKPAPKVYAPEEKKMLNAAKKVIAVALKEVNVEKTVRNTINSWYKKDADFGIPEYRVPSEVDRLASAAHVKPADRPARKELSLKATELIGRMCGRNEQALNITRKLAQTFLKDEAREKALKYIEKNKTSLEGFLTLRSDAKSSLNNLKTVEILSSGTVEQKRELILSKMQSLTEKMKGITVNSGKMSHEETFDFIEKNYDVLNTVNGLKRFLSGKEGQHSGISLDEITAFKNNIRESDSVYCKRFNELCAIHNPIYQYIDKEGAGKYLKELGDIYASTMKNCQDRIDALPQNAAGASQRGVLNQQKVACLAGIVTVNMLSSKAEKFGIDKMDYAEISFTDFYLEKQTAITFNSRVFKEFAETCNTDSLYKQEDGKTVLNAEEADICTTLYKRQELINDYNKKNEAEQIRLANKQQNAPIQPKP